MVARTGLIKFDVEDKTKVIQIDLVDVAKNQPMKIELFDPSNNCHIGENKIANISFVGKLVFGQQPLHKQICLIHVSILACCTKLNVTLSGDASKYIGSKSGIYYMQHGFTNGRRFWLSPEHSENALWYEDDRSIWVIGRVNIDLYLPTKHHGEECPNENLQSNWWYNAKNEWVEDTNGSVSMKCLSS